MVVTNKINGVGIRLQDIANELDVSVMTVSRSLRHDTSISPQTRARVHEVARRLGYRGRSGKTQEEDEKQVKAGSVGLLLRHNTLEAAHSDTMLVRMMGGIMSVLDSRDIRLKLHTWPGDERPHLDEDPSTVPAMIQNNECRAIIVQGYHEDRNLDFLSHRMPVVSLGRQYRDLHVDAVVADNVDGIRCLVAELAKAGHRRLAWVGASFDWSFMESRQAGFLQGCMEHRLELNPQFCFGPEIWDFTHIGQPEGLIAAAKAGVTGFVCGNDYIALAVAKHLEAAGLQVPQDASVTGFDGYGNKATVGRITSINPNFFEIGKWAAELVLRRLAQPQGEPCVITVRGKLVSGDTIAPSPLKK